MAAVRTLESAYISVPDVVEGQVSGLPGKADQLSLPPAVVREIIVSVSDAGTRVSRQFHDIHTKRLSVV